MRDIHEQSPCRAQDEGRWLIAEPRTLAAVVQNCRGAGRGLLACSAFLALWTPRAALAQTVSVASPAPSLGNVAAASSGVTIFRFSPTGAVTKLSGSGDRPPSSTSTMEFQVTIACSTCDKSNTTVTIAATGSTGRAGLLTNFNVALGSGTALATGTTLPSPGSPYTFTLGPISKKTPTASFTIGADFPINGDTPAPAGATGLATTSISITAGSKPAVGASATANVLRALSISGTNLDFGRIVRPATGSSAISIPATTGTRSVSNLGVGLPTPTPTRALFTALGEPSQVLTLTIPTTVSLKDGNGDTMTIATSNNAPSSPSLDTNGTLTFYMGGGFTISSTTPTGAYTGTFTVTASYN